MTVFRYPEMTALRDLRWDIQQQLHQLASSANKDLLYKLAVSCQDEVEEDLPGVESTEVELFDFIVDFLRSKQLRSLEDQGMARLLVFRDLIDELQSPQTVEGLGQAPDEDHSDSMSETEPVAPVMSKTAPTSVGADQVTGLVKLTDVTALLPRREFRIHSGQISDSGSDVSYSSLGRQIDEGLSENFTEAEVVRAVLKIIKPGTFRDMLMTKDGLTVAELKRFLRAHLRDKSSAELFQELSNAKQQEKESPQQFMYRLMGLKQRVLFASQQSSSEFKYEDKLVHGVFLHSLYQGLSEKYAYVRRDLKPLISNQSVTEDFILEIMTNSISEEVERQARLGQTHKAKVVTVNATQQGERQHAVQPPAEVQASVLQTQAEVQANRTAIHELTAHVSALARTIEKVFTPITSVAELPQVNLASTVQASKHTSKGKCKSCTAQGTASCNHCFRCGQEGHRAVGCLSKTKPAGNVMGSLGRDHQ